MSAKVDLKIVLLGHYATGKTSLVQRYLHGKFNEQVSATVGAAFGAKKLTINDKTLTLGVWDTAGSERYESMSRIYYRGAKAAIVCYDITNLESLNKVKMWTDEVRTHQPQCSLYIVGTKLDLEAEREITKAQVMDIANTSGAHYLECSSKTGENVEELFTQIAEEFVADRNRAPETGGVDITAPPPAKKGCC